ncbi:MAG: carboxypeptidase-like regulatory domain-containing protein, partial [Bacteroidota bacterium]
MKKITLLCLLLFVYYTGWSQDDRQILLSGTVYDANDKTPLPFANVSFDQKRYGVVCNDKGQFRLLIPLRFKEQVMTISYLGYENQEVKISDQHTALRIFLSPASIT